MRFIAFVGGSRAVATLGLVVTLGACEGVSSPADGAAPVDRVPPPPQCSAASAADILFVVDNSNGTTFTAGTDGLIKLTGITALNNADVVVF